MSESSDPWIYKMTIVKFKVHRHTGAVKHGQQFTKTLNKTENEHEEKEKSSTKKESVILDVEEENVGEKKW